MHHENANLKANEQLNTLALALCNELWMLLSHFDNLELSFEFVLDFT